MKRYLAPALLFCTLATVPAGARSPDQGFDGCVHRKLDAQVRKTWGLGPREIFSVEVSMDDVNRVVKKCEEERRTQSPIFTESRVEHKHVLIKAYGEQHYTGEMHAVPKYRFHRNY